MKESFCCKTRQGLLTNCDAIESLCLEKQMKNQKHNSRFETGHQMVA